jgi:peptidoglycan-associated lipoprotein
MRRALLLVAPVLAIALAGCPSKPKDGECKTSADCEAQEGFGKVCVDGRCQECAVDTDCKAGFACRQNKCVPKPECSRDGDCPSGKICEAGKCAVPPPPRAECSQDADCPSGRGCEAGKCVSKAAAVPECPADLKYPAVYFAFDQAALTAESRATLEKNADCIRKQATKQIVIEGNCDERGTVEYNLQLGQRRAEAVRKYFANLGLPAKNIKTVSYGKERPICTEHAEDCWSKNRRADVIGK